MIISTLLASSIVLAQNSSPLPEKTVRAAVRKVFPILDEDRTIVSDAIKRWRKIEVGSGSMTGRMPIVIQIGEQRCVQLKLVVSSVGASPTYCYKVVDDTFLRAYAEGE